MKINPVNGWSQNFSAYENSQSDYSKKFSKVLDNVKQGRPADYDEETVKSQKTTTMTQILSDGSTVITVYGENGKILYQSRTASTNPDADARTISSRVENNFGLDELKNFNLVNIQ